MTTEHTGGVKTIEQIKREALDTFHDNHDDGDLAITKAFAQLESIMQDYAIEARTDEFNAMLKHGEESYLGEDWFSDENIKDHSACEIPLSYIDKRKGELEQLRTTNLTRKGVL